VYKFIDYFGDKKLTDKPKEKQVSINKFLVILTLIFMMLSGVSVAEAVNKSDASEVVVSYEAGKRLSFRSTILAENRELLIHLPKGYEASDKKYPVIYMLDGNGHFQHATTAITYLEGQRMMPESIIVGIVNYSGMRSRDLGEGSDRFWGYIQKEVISHVESKYRTSAHKTLFGHSMAGTFVLERFLDNVSFFNGYIAASPGMPLELYQRFNEYFHQSKNKLNATAGRALFLSMAGAGAEGTENVLAASKLHDLLAEKAAHNFNWKYLSLPSLTHMTTPLVTFHQGISQVFSDYQAPSYDSYQDFIDRDGMKGIQKTYLDRSVKYQVANEVPDNLVRRLGRTFFRGGHKKEAITLLNENISNYPESIWAHNSLARLYDQSEQFELSLHNFKKAKKLAENQKNLGAIEYLKSEIDRVKNKV
jgi:predicted alpha/beta superfamily hydrolase